MIQNFVQSQVGHGLDSALQDFPFCGWRALHVEVRPWPNIFACPCQQHVLGHEVERDLVAHPPLILLVKVVPVLVTNPQSDSTVFLKSFR